MKRTAVRSNVDGSFELVSVDLEFEVYDLQPNLSLISRCPECGEGGTRSSFVCLFQDKFHFARYQIDIQHTKECKAPVHQYTRFLDTIYEMVNHRGPIFFLKSDGKLIPGDEKRNYENAAKYCEWIDCTETDLEFIAKTVKKTDHEPQDPSSEDSLLRSCTIL
jgi:hypothetical protein